MQGWRVEMEDAHSAKCAGLCDDERLRDWSYFAVFDGHAGARVSAHCADHLLDAIVAQEEFGEDVIKGIRQGFLGNLYHLSHNYHSLAHDAENWGDISICIL